MYIANIFNFSGPNMLWLWLYPATYLLHIAEEYWGGTGYIAHLAKTKGVVFTPLRFFSLTIFGWVLMVVGVILADRCKFPQLLLVIFGTLVLGHVLSHTVSRVRTAKYNPGLLTGLLIWLPLGAITLVQLQGSMSGGRYWTGLVIGIGIQGMVLLIAARGGSYRRPAAGTAFTLRRGVSEAHYHQNERQNYDSSVEL